MIFSLWQSRTSHWQIHLPLQMYSCFFCFENQVKIHSKWQKSTNVEFQGTSTNIFRSVGQGNQDMQAVHISHFFFSFSLSFPFLFFLWPVPLEMVLGMVFVWLVFTVCVFFLVLMVTPFSLRRLSSSHLFSRVIQFVFYFFSLTWLWAIGWFFIILWALSISPSHSFCECFVPFIE